MEGWVADGELEPTTDMVQGPFYPVIKPEDQDADLTVIKGRPNRAEGQLLYVKGRVINLRGEPLPGTRVEIWQANTHGRYTHPNDNNPAPLDPNFEGYGVQTTDAQGNYRFKTIKPGAYPTPMGWMRAPHIHFCVTSRKTQLITQIYFAGEPLDAADLLLKSSLYADSLIKTLSPPEPGMEPEALVANFDIVLGET